jgi:hypothetical protein
MKRQVFLALQSYAISLIAGTSNIAREKKFWVFFFKQSLRKKQDLSLFWGTQIVFHPYGFSRDSQHHWVMRQGSWQINSFCTIITFETFK